MLEISGDISAEVGEITRPIDFITAPPFPTLGEGAAIDLDLVNGVDPRNLVLGANADATIIFRDEIAAQKNTLGVVLIGADGSLGPARIVFANVEHAEAIPGLPLVRPGGGPLSPGDEVSLSDLYGAGQLAAGQQFAFFTIADGFRFNGDLTGAELVFRNADGTPASVDDPSPALFALLPDGTLVPLAGASITPRRRRSTTRCPTSSTTAVAARSSRVSRRTPPASPSPSRTRPSISATPTPTTTSTT